MSTRRRTSTLDSQWEVERIQRSEKRVGADDLNGTHVLAGVNGDYAASDRILTRAARFVIRKAQDDAARGDLLEACGLDWDQASPVPVPKREVPAGFKECTSCREVKHVDQFRHSKHVVTSSRCRDCDKAESAGAA